MHPGPGDSTAEISINYYGAGIDYARGERVGADPYTAYACDSSVVIHAEISVRTATGAIDGSFAVPIEFRTGTNGVGLADVQDAAIRDYSLQWADGRSSVRRALKFELQPSGEQAGEFFDIAKGSSEADPQVWFPAATWSCPLIVD